MSIPADSTPLRQTGPSRVKVKICGITNPEDAEAAIEAGADALGFNGFTGSKRYIDLQKASDWISKLPPFVTRVAVLVNPTIEEAEEIAALPGIDVLQFHGHESSAFCNHFARKGFIKALAARDEFSLAHREEFATNAILLDAFVPGAYGGTGQLIDLSLAAQIVRKSPRLSIILSGGLKAENVADAIEKVRPYGVDVASGVESHPRKKDKSMMREFIFGVWESRCQ